MRAANHASPRRAGYTTQAGHAHREHGDRGDVREEECPVVHSAAQFCRKIPVIVLTIGGKPVLIMVIGCPFPATPRNDEAPIATTNLLDHILALAVIGLHLPGCHRLLWIARISAQTAGSTGSPAAGFPLEYEESLRRDSEPWPALRAGSCATMRQPRPRFSQPAGAGPKASGLNARNICEMPVSSTGSAEI